ncbi:MAG TPA: hypothetical protein VFQ37_17640 [Mycobacterium sp.]|nr:hypothetical protein [Mycobacterium sp.]
MDPVLGLSLTPTTVGWVVVDEQGVNGAMLSRDELTVGRHCGGGDSANTSEQAAAAVLCLQAMVEERGQRLRGVGVTWSGDAAAEAALLLESLTEAGLDNVVPVRFRQAAESLTGAVGPIARSDQIAACIVEPGMATVVMMDGCGDDAAGTAQHATEGEDDLTSWLTRLFTPEGWWPGALVVAGSGTALDKLAARLGSTLAIPVFAQTGAHLALAHGAALALAPCAEFAETPLDGAPVDFDRGPVRSRTLSYAGALTMLVAGVLTFVVSLSTALSLQLIPAKELPPAEQVAHGSTTPSVARAAAPAVTPSPALPEAPVSLGSLWEGAPAEDGGAASVRPPAPTAVAPQPSGPRSLLNRVLEHMPHLRGH